MDAASFRFVAFGLAVAVVSNFSSSRAWRSLVLLGASLAFLGLLAHSFVVLLPLAGFLLLGYVGHGLLQSGKSKSAVWTILAVICSYLWLKKYTFLPEAGFLQRPYFTLGLSYIFFRVLHLLIEAGEVEGKDGIGLRDYLIYTLNFTTLISGPIQRYDDFAKEQFAAVPISLGPRVAGLQLERIVRGMFKVNVLAAVFNIIQADALAQISQPVPASLKLLAAFRLVVVYPLFLYANFSGYMDIVIALARLMRLRLPENFDRPFTSTSFLEFWNRWHITLSGWLKSYVYNPLLVWLMRRFPAPSTQPFLGVFCFFVTFFLVGVWHGRTSEFVVFGILQGGGVAINKLWQMGLTGTLGRKGYNQLAGEPAYFNFCRGLTFTWFAFTLIWFWANWQQIGTIFAGLSAARWTAVWVAIWFSATLTLAAWEWLRKMLLSFETADGPVLTNRYARVVYASVLGMAAFIIMVLLAQPSPDIVYKAF